MEISKEHFFLASQNSGVSQEQAQVLWEALEFHNLPKTSPYSRLFYYFGALIVLCAMSWFLNLGWIWFGGLGIFSIASIYGIGLSLLGAKLWHKSDLKIPAGLLLTLAVCMVPLAIYGMEIYLNIWPTNYSNPNAFLNHFQTSWMPMEIGAIIAGIIALQYFAFPFLTAPIFFSAWLLIMDTILFFNKKEYSWEDGNWASLISGIFLIFIAYFINRRQKEDYAFWGYLFGTFLFWTSLSFLSWDKGEAFLFIFFLINISMMVLSILLKRKIFIIFGALGAFMYLSHLTYDVFEDSLLFPFILSFIGLIVIYLGVLYQKNIEWIEKKIVEKMPISLRKFLP